MAIQPSKGYNAYYGKNKRRDDREGNERSRKRFKSEAPLGQQLRNATLSNPDHRRRIRALQGLPPEEDDEEEEHNIPPPSTLKKSHNDSREDRASAVDLDERNSKSAVPGLGDILNSFKVPEGPRVFKSEPVDIGLWDSMLAPKPKPRRKQKKDKQDNVEQAAPPAKEISANIPEMPDGRNARDTHDVGTSAQAASRDVVDLTEENDEREGSSSQAPVPQAPTQVPTSHLRRPLAATQVQIMDQIDVPQNILQQAIDIYRRENIGLPVTTKKWAQLKNFVAQHPTSLISPQLCLVAQAHAFNAASAPTTFRPPPASTNSNTDAGWPNERQPAPAGALGRDNVREERVVSEEPQIKIEPEDTIQLNRQEEAHAKPSPADPANFDNRPNSDRAQVPVGTPRATARPPQDLHAQADSADGSRPRNQNLMQPIDLIPDILPPDAPAGHPRLIKLWDPVLLSLPSDQYDHLTIQDTIVSILAKYDMKTKSVVAAFLDVKKVNHFFFLFKAKENSLHSWSIEREEDVITIGIERPTRAPNLNTADQSRPSSGQYDLTLQYRVLPSPPTLSASNSNASQALTYISPDHITSADLDRHLAAHNNTKTQYPGRWLLINTSIFPSDPDLPIFLYHTPPTRGADSHEIYTHPQQTPQLPPAYLSMFARYMANTCFSTSVMDAEIQVAFGRKVRYDAVLGRVRVLWDYALKGARTQRAKRERGEYNRPQVQQKKGGGAIEESGGGGGSSNGSGAGLENKEVPGYGLSASYLARSLGKEGRGGSTLVGEMDGFVVEDGAVRNGEVGSGMRGEDEERMGKIVKRERMRREGDESGSEYSDGSDGSE